MSYSTEELITILNSLPMAVIVIDENRRIIRANTPTLLFLGKSMEEVLGKKGGEAFNCPYVKDHIDGCGAGQKCGGCTLKNVIISTLTTGKAIKRLELSIPLIDGTIHDLMITTNVAYLQNKKVILLAVEDITELKKEENLKIKQIQLATALEMVGGMSHELSQPLMVILGFSSLLKESLTDPKYIDQIDALYKCSLRLKNTIRDLQKITNYKSKSYINGKIVDITESARTKKTSV